MLKMSRTLHSSAKGTSASRGGLIKLEEIVLMPMSSLRFHQAEGSDYKIDLLACGSVAA